MANAVLAVTSQTDGFIHPAVQSVGCIDWPARTDLKFLQRLDELVRRLLLLLQHVGQFGNLLVDDHLILRLVVALHQGKLFAQRGDLVVLDGGREVQGFSITESGF